MSGTCPTSTPSPPSPTLTLTPIPPTPQRPTWPFSLPTIFSTLSLDSVRTLPPAPTTMLLSIAMLFMTTILLLWRSSRNRSRARRATIQRIHRRLEEANAKQAEYETQLEQEREARRQREEERRWAQEEKRKVEEERRRLAEEKRKVEEERRRLAEEKRKLEQEARVMRSRLEEKEKQKALLQVGILKLRRKAEAVSSELDDARREVERRAEQLERLVEQATPFLELLRIDLDVDLPPTIQPPALPSSSSSTAVQTRAGKAPLPKPETDPDELLPKSLLTSLNNHISSLSAKLADEGVRVIREVEDALDEADEWVDAMHREEVRPLEEGSELEVDSDRDRDKASPSHGRRASPQQHQKGATQAKETPPRSQIPVLVSSPMYFPPTERRLMESPRSLHEVELPPVGPPPRGPLPPIPPSPPRAPGPPPKPSSIPRPLSTASESRLRAPSSTSSQPRPFSAPVQSSPPRHQRASPPPALPLSGSALQKPPRTTPPDLQHSPPTQYMYPYPYSNQQQPMGIPVSLAKGFGSSASASARQSPSSAPLALAGSTSTHRSSKPSSRSSSAASLVPFPTGSSSSLAGAKPSSISSAQWERLGPYDRQVLLRERAEREREARLEKKRLAKQEAKRRRQAEREARRREREAAKAEKEKRRKEEQAKREEAVEARVQAGEVFGEGLVGMLKEAGVRRGVFTEKVERKASTPTPKASLSGGKNPGSGEGASGESGTGASGSDERGGSGGGGGDGTGKDSGKGREEEWEKEKEENRAQSVKSKIDLHTTLKLAFQTALCAYTHWMMCSWFFEDERGGVASGNGAGDAGGHEGGEGLEGLLGEVYARVREGEEQLVSGLWRSLTRKHVQRMLPGASSGSSSKRSSKDSERQGKIVAGDYGEESEEEDGRPDTLIEELCIYIIDALVNVLIVAGAHGGWYVGSGDEDISEEDVSEVEEEEDKDDDDDDSGEDIIVHPLYQHATQQTAQHSSPHIVPMEDAALGGGDYNPDPIDLDSDLYHDPYQGYSISQLSEFLSVTPTADTFKIGGRRGQTGQVPPGNVLLQGQPQQRPHARSRSPPQSHFPSSSRVPEAQRLGRTSASPNTRPRPRRSRSATRLQAHSESTSKYTQEYLHAHLTAAFKIPLMRILKKARVLNKVLGEEVVRCDLEALYVAPGVGFVGDMMERGVVDPVGSHVEKEDVEPESGQELEASVDADLNDDGEDTPRPASSPNSKRGTGGKASPQQTGVAVAVSTSAGAGVPEAPPQPQGGSPERSSQNREVEWGSPHEEGSEEAEILCTTQLGLVRAEKVPRTRGEWDEVVLVKPVVILMRDVVSA